MTIIFSLEHPLYTVYDHLVRFIYLRCLNGGKVDLCRYLRVVSHSSADDVDRYMGSLGNAGPTVPGHIEGQQ